MLNLPRRVAWLLLSLAVSFLVLSACSGNHGGVSPNPTETSTRVPSVTPSPTGTNTATPTTTRPPTALPVTATPFVMPQPSPGWRPDGSRGVMALTIDSDGETGFTAGILQTLEAYGTKASFGVTGMWVQRNPALLQQLVRDGDAVMNHSWSHVDFTKLTREQRLAELQRTEDIVGSTAGVSTKPFFRPPFGAVDASVRADAAAAGYVTVLWNIDPQGWRGKPAEQIEANVFANARDGGIVLFHVEAYGDYQALGTVIETLWNAGYRFVTIGELLGVPPSATPTHFPPSATPFTTPSPTLEATSTRTPAAISTETPSPASS